MVRTRFAPSPTGFLHIGGVRTALFNWLYARANGGRFILRIDDTDKERNVAEALEPILHGFKWLGMDWDEGPEVGGEYGPYYQSERSGKYAAAAEQLLASGHAYRDYAKTEEIAAEREAAKAGGGSFTYSRKWMADTDEKRAAFEAEGREGVVRLKMPREGACEFTDLILGPQSVDWANEQDHVVQRADGSVLYNLANVVDDYEMKISHVIRAQEHLSNTPRQIFIAQALGHPLPEYAHIPFVAEPGSKNKLSKRKIAKYIKNPDFGKLHQHGEEIANLIGLETSAETFNPVLVEFYEKVGYLPDAVVNYLLLLGWAKDGSTEEFTRQEMIEAFSFDGVNKGPASLDAAKLTAFQERYMNRLSEDEKVTMVTPYLERSSLVSSPPSAEQAAIIRRIVSEAGERIKVAGDVLDYAYFFCADDQVRYDDKAVEKHIKKEPELLKAARQELGEAEFTPEAIQAALENVAGANGVKIGKVNQPVRVAVTGKDTGFGTYETIVMIGKDRCLARIDAVLARL